jgi:hypothetical protein
MVDLVVPLRLRMEIDEVVELQPKMKSREGNAMRLARLASRSNLVASLGKVYNCSIERPWQRL